MNTYGIILKSIKEELEKCSQRLTLNPKLLNAMHNFREETCNPKKPRKTEKGLLLNAEGEVISSKTQNNKHSVEWGDSDEILNLYNENGELALEHNHPLYDDEKLPVFLSHIDIMALGTSKATLETGVYEDEEYVFKSVTCEGGNGTRMTMVRGDNFSMADKRAVDMIAFQFSNDVFNYYEDYCSDDVISKKFYEIRDKYFEENPNVQMITDEQVSQFTEQAKKEVFDSFDPYPIFREYKKKFREHNLNLTWESGL